MGKNVAVPFYMIMTVLSEWRMIFFSIWPMIFISIWRRKNDPLFNSAPAVCESGCGSRFFCANFCHENTFLETSLFSSANYRYADRDFRHEIRTEDASHFAPCRRNIFVQRNKASFLDLHTKIPYIYINLASRDLCTKILTEAAQFFVTKNVFLKVHFFCCKL